MSVALYPRLAQLLEERRLTVAGLERQIEERLARWHSCIKDDLERAMGAPVSCANCRANPSRRASLM